MTVTKSGGICLETNHFSTNYDEVTTLCQELLSAPSIKAVHTAEPVLPSRTSPSTGEGSQVQKALLRKKTDQALCVSRWISLSLGFREDFLEEETRGTMGKKSTLPYGLINSFWYAFFSPTLTAILI